MVKYLDDLNESCFSKVSLSNTYNTTKNSIHPRPYMIANTTLERIHIRLK